MTLLQFLYAHYKSLLLNRCWSPQPQSIIIHCWYRLNILNLNILLISDMKFDCDVMSFYWILCSFGLMLNLAIPYIVPSVKCFLSTIAMICSGRNVFFLPSKGFCTVTYCFLNCITGGFPSHFLTFASLNDCQVKQQFIWPIAFWRDTKVLMWLALPQRHWRAGGQSLTF